MANNCVKCGDYLNAHERPEGTCYECRELAEPGEVTHSSLVRCPKCGFAWAPEGCDGEARLFEEGSHGAMCGECNHNFDVTTYVSYLFTSPARLKEGGK